MGQLVQDEAGQIFVDTGGGVLTPITEEQAALYQRGADMNPVAGAAMAANEGLKGLASGLLGLGSDDYRAQALASKKNSEALSLAQPMAGGAGQYFPQAVLGATSMGAGILPTMGVEGVIGAASAPENPMMGAMVGAGLGLGGELLPGAVGWAGNKARNIQMPFGWGKAASPYDEIPVNPGGMMEGERAPLSRGVAQGPARQAPASTRTPDLTTHADSPPNMGPQLPPDPLELLRAKVAQQDQQAAIPRGRTAAQGPSDNGIDEGDFIEGEPGAPLPAPSMSERVTDSLRQADQATGGEVAPLRVMEGTLTPDELYVRGVPTTAGDRANLTARAGDEAGGAAARELRRSEDKLESHPLLGGGIRNIRDAQQQAATNFLGRQLDVPFGVNLTDPMVSDIKKSIGGRLDEIAGEMGTVPITQGIKDQFDQVLGQTTGAHKNALKQLTDEIQAMAELGGGALDGNQWQIMRTKFDDMIKSGIGQKKADKVFDAERMMKVMIDTMEGSLPDATKAELRKLRKQYAIASTLQKRGARNSDGQLNPLSFYGNWKQGQWGSQHGQDEIGRFLNTIVTLTAKRTPDSGTAGRFFAGQAASAAANMIPGVGTVRGMLGL